MKEEAAERLGGRAQREAPLPLGGGVRAAEWIFLAYQGAVALLLALFASEEVRFWGLAIQASLVFVTFTVASARRLGVGEALYPWYLIGLLLVSFRVLGWYVPAVHPVEFDGALSRIDRAVFGLGWDRPPAIGPPLWTDVLQLAYTSYYVIPLAVLIGARGAARRSRVGAVLLMGFLLSYILYFVAPARGPYIHHELEAPQGTAVARWIRATIVRLEGTMWDAFPSGHTLVAVLAVWVALRERAWLGWILAPCVLLLVLSTVLLRYHYVVDVAVGLALVPCSYGMGSLAYRWLESPRGLAWIPSPGGPRSAPEGGRP